MSAKFLEQIPIPEEKPSIAEIAAMPYPHSLVAMRKFYNSQWGIPIPDGAEAMRKFKVTMNFSYTERDSRTYHIEAYCEDEANRLADDLFEKDGSIPADWSSNIEIEDVEIEEVEVTA